MAVFLIRRFLTAIPLLFGVSIIVFLMIQLVPGDPVMLMLGSETNLSRNDIEILRQEMGFNDPLHVQYFRYLGDFFKGEMGQSIRTKSAVSHEISVRIPHTIQLAVLSMGFAILVGITMGIVSALNHNTIIDNISSAITLLGVSLPSFWLALLLILFFGLYLRWLPVTSTPDTGFKGLILPALTLGLSAQTSIARLVRSGMLEVMMNDYIRTARAKGLKQQVIITRHALRNSLIPAVTVIGIQFGSILAGTTIIETVFGRLGLGLLLINSILVKDFPVIQAIMMMVSGTYIIINILVEALYVFLDPRIRLS